MNRWRTILLGLMFWIVIGTITKFHGMYFVIMSILLGVIVVGNLIKQLYYKEKRLEK